MATSKEYLNYILECLSETDNITYKQMMGEYIIYYREKIAAYVADDRLLVNPVEAAIKMMKNARYEPPYEGAKEMLLVDNVEDKMFLKKLFEAMYDSLPMPKRKSEIKAKKLSRKEIPCALELVRSVFLEFDAKDYSKEGVQEFMNTLDNNGFVESLKFYGAFEGKEMVGVLAMREKQHISLFFVKADHHKKGIGRKLFEYMKNDYAIREFTVNSAPYAAEVYLRLGFVDTAAEQITNNIRYIPMKYTEENRKADIESLVNLLEDKNNTVACGAMNCLSETAQNSDAVYKYMDKFIKMLSSSNSYVRNRGLKLISVNAKWDTDFKIDEIIDEYLKHITDIKPITARQCISFLPEMVKHKKDLKEDILSALSSADVTKYPDSMQGLVLKDIKKAIREIESCE